MGQGFDRLKDPSYKARRGKQRAKELRSSALRLENFAHFKAAADLESKEAAPVVGLEPSPS
jgi:hypothetical protein